MPSQTFCDAEICALEAAGFEVEIWSCSPPTTSFRHGAEDWPKARVSYAPPPEALTHWEAAARREGTWPAATSARHEADYGPRYDPAKRARHALYFAGLLRRQGVEHLHVHFANRATHAALFIHELTGISFSFTAHAQDFLVDLGSDALLAEMCQQAAFVVAVSEWSRRALLDKCPAAAGKVHRVYNGLPLARWPAPEAARPCEALRILSVGRLIDFKGFPDLIAACALLQARGVAFRCEIAGEGPLRETLARQIGSVAGLSERVQLLGLLPQDQVRARLAGCDVFALACRVDEKGACDVLPTVILEAMAAGRPVVSTRLAGVPEMVADGETGVLVAPGDPVALADALEGLANDSELRDDFGRAGRRKLTAEFSAEQSARQLGALLFAAKVGSDFVATTADSASTLVLIERWPFEGSPSDFSQTLPGVDWMALESGSGALDVASLPDALVLEGWWRAHAGVAHQIESWRGTLGSGCQTDDFLRAARRALYLHFLWQREVVSPRHIHAMGAGAVLCAWMLIRLGTVEAASFFLGRDAGLAGATLRRMAPSFVGGWIVGERKVAASLGAGFHAEEPTAKAWAEALGQIEI